MINFIKTAVDSDGNTFYDFDATPIDFATEPDVISDDTDYVFDFSVTLNNNRTDIVCEYCDHTDFTNRPLAYQSDGHYGFHLCLDHLLPAAQQFMLDKISTL